MCEDLYVCMFIVFIPGVHGVQKNASDPCNWNY